MAYRKYLREDGTQTGWLESPENESDRPIYSLGPMRRKYSVGEIANNKRYGKIECIESGRIVNEDECGDWMGPSYYGLFVRC